MLCKNVPKNRKILLVGLLSMFLILGFVSVISSGFMEEETTKTIISGKYQITISEDEYEWVDTVSIINKQLKIVAKESGKRTKDIPSILPIYDKKTKISDGISTSISEGKDIFIYNMTGEEEYLKFGTSSIVIIEITDADHLNSTRGWIKDVYDNVSILDNITVTINSEEYLRVKFKHNLTSGNDITIYASSKDSASVEVYEEDSDRLIADFGIINNNISEYKIYLTKLNESQDTFDLKVVKGDVEFDFVIDPTLTYATVQDVYGILGDGTSKTGVLNTTFQVRSCNDAICSGETFVGPDNTSSTYFTNATFNTLNETLTPNNTYFQYKAFFYTEDQNYTSYLFNVTIGYTEADAGDSTPPTFTTIPANTTINYTQGFGVDFDATDETEFDTYAINWTTLFEINSTGYLKNSTANIAVGTYLINVTINDTSNNLNSTIYKVTINKATTNLGITGTTPVTYGTTTNVAGTDCPSQLSCSLDKANAVYGVGTETFNYSTAGNENYTSDYITKGIVITQISSSVNLTLNEIQGNTSINEDTSINLNCSTINGDSGATLKLYNNGTLINSGTSPLGNYTLFSEPGDYNITCIYEDTQNYTTSTTTFWLEVNDTTSPVWSSNETNLTSSTPINDSVYFNITLNDINPDSYIFSWYNGTNWENTTNTYTDGEEISIIKQILNDTVTINWTWYINDTLNNLNQTDVWSVDLSGDSIDPVVTKLSPASSIVTTGLTQTYIYNVSDTNNITSCSLLMNGITADTDSSINKSENNSFTYTQSTGTYIWSIECDDEHNNTGTTGNFSIQFYIEYGSGTGSSYDYYSQCYNVVDGICKYTAFYDAPCPDDYFTSLELCKTSLEPIEPTIIDKILDIEFPEIPEDIAETDTFKILIMLSFGGLIVFLMVNSYKRNKNKKIGLIYKQ